ncbi:hydroxymethylbilane synthase [Thioalkalivibrio sp. HK1]|uniref:hydroxymethylbilane synthase n=1 Tax=Thioalkalivibrio sp. HK1 TaxID=1469245 RepID=UPI0018CC150B
MSPLRIATRRSPLALTQAEFIARALGERYPDIDIELLPIRTTGDRLLDAPLARFGGKGLFIKELEQALLDGRADLAVHSMKDVPVELPAGLALPVITARADPHDALVSKRFDSLRALPPKARIGTSSLRRRCQLAAHRPDLTIDVLRGGIDTRIKRLAAGDFDAIVLAVAGLERGGYEKHISEILPESIMLPAAGQGALGIECRADDARIRELIAPLACPDSTRCVEAERAFGRLLDGGCQMPIAAFATLRNGGLALRALVASLDGRRVLRTEIEGGIDDPRGLGTKAAQAMLDQGAQAILDEVRSELEGQVLADAPSPPSDPSSLGLRRSDS